MKCHRVIWEFYACLFGTKMWHPESQVARYDGSVIFMHLNTLGVCSRYNTLIEFDIGYSYTHVSIETTSREYLIIGHKAFFGESSRVYKVLHGRSKKNCTRAQSSNKVIVQQLRLEQKLRENMTDLTQFNYIAMKVDNH